MQLCNTPCSYAHTRPIEGRVQAGCHEQSTEYGYDGVVTLLARLRRRGQYRLTGLLLMPPNVLALGCGRGGMQGPILSLTIHAGYHTFSGGQGATIGHRVCGASAQTAGARRHFMSPSECFDTLRNAVK